MLLKNGIQPNQAKGIVLRQRRQVQDDPDVVRALGRHAKELKAVYDRYCDPKNRRQFRWKTSALRLFEMQEEVAPTKGGKEAAANKDDYWKPLTVDDIWQPFVHCMMTVLDENQQSSKYWHLLYVEFNDWLGRIALRYHELLNEE